MSRISPFSLRNVRPLMSMRDNLTGHSTAKRPRASAHRRDDFRSVWASTARSVPKGIRTAWRAPRRGASAPRAELMPRRQLFYSQGAHSYAARRDSLIPAIHSKRSRFHPSRREILRFKALARCVFHHRSVLFTSQGTLKSYHVAS